MKKLKLSELDLGNAEVLTREQLKKVLGGLSSDLTWSCNCVGGGSDSCEVTGSSESDYWFTSCCGYTGYVEYSHQSVSSCS